MKQRFKKNPGTRELIKNELGSWGEELAALALSRVGYRILETNWRCQAGQIDIIAVQAKQLVAVEVKTRHGSDFGSSTQALTKTQVARIQRALLEYQHQSKSGYIRAQQRIDLVAITIDENGEPDAQLLQDVAS